MDQLIERRRIFQRRLVGRDGEAGDFDIVEARRSARGQGLPERWDDYGADGFNIMAPILPTGLSDFIELVLPELRRRGLFRHEYEGRTLRENLGLRVPPDGYSQR